MIVDLKAERRGPILIGNFVDGYVQGWRFAVPEVFRQALDIKLEQQTRAGVTSRVWSQGNQYDFHIGSVFYDTRLAYEVTWGEALKHLRFAVQIKEFIAPQWQIYESIEILSKDIKATRMKGGKTTDLSISDGFIVNRHRLSPGKVLFSLMQPSIDRSTVEHVAEFECSAEEFVAFLQSGMITERTGKRIDIFERYHALESK